MLQEIPQKSADLITAFFNPDFLNHRLGDYLFGVGLFIFGGYLSQTFYI
jgi:hypothetical protein